MNCKLFVICSVLILALAPSVSVLDHQYEWNYFSQTNDDLNCSETNYSQGDIIHVDNQLGQLDFPGTINCPLATLSSALQIAESGDIIELHEGVYHETVVVDDFENLTIRAALNERIVFDGTQSISADLGANWQNSTDGIHEVSLGIDAWQVFTDYFEQVPARWPNANFSDMSVLNQTHNWAHGTISDGGNYSNGELQDSDDLISLNNSGIDPVGSIAILNVGSFKTWSRIVETYDNQTGIFTYEPVPNWKSKHHYYFLEGKRELIDTPGEWWFNNSDNKLHMMFEDGIEPNQLDIRVKTQAYAFNITNSNNITIEGFEFFATTFRTENCDGCVVADSDLLYPSTSKRSLGISGEDVTDRWVSRMDFCSNCLIDNCSFAHTDGSAIEFHGGSIRSHNNTINNSRFDHIDWSSSDLMGLMVTVYDGGRDHTFSNNTVKLAGASSTLSIGDSPRIMFNDISQTGFIQSDGAVVQMMMAEQEGADIGYNWIHDTEKYGIRMDGPAGGINTGRNSSVHHNVLWNVKTGIMVKGDYHDISNNTVFGGGLDLGKNDIIILFENNDGNENSTSNNNAADKISAHRSNDNSSNPVPGIFLDNFNGYDFSNTVESMLVDPSNNDFRPLAGSLLDNLSAGAYDADDTNPWIAGSIIKWNRFSNPILGCTNITAINFDLSAGVVDHSCEFESVSDQEEILENTTDEEPEEESDEEPDEESDTDVLVPVPEKINQPEEETNPIWLILSLTVILFIIIIIRKPLGSGK